MSKLTERLRGGVYGIDRIPLCKEAADRIEHLERVLVQAREALTCEGGDFDPGHRCGHCDDYVDRNGIVRAAIDDALKEKP